MRQVGPGTEIDEVSLLVARNLVATFVTDKLDLQVFALLGENHLRLFFGHFESFQCLIGFDPLAHPLFDSF